MKPLKHYHIFTLALLLAAVIAVDQFAYHYVCSSSDPLVSILSAEQWRRYIHIAAAAGYLYIAFDSIRQTSYADKTGGRSYHNDYARYRKTYSWMVSYFKDNKKLRMDVSTLPEKKWYEVDGVILGKIGNRIIHKPTEAAGNIVLFGLPGTGKTASVIIPTAIRFGGSVLCVDIKGDIEQAVRKYTHDGRKIKVFNPEDSQGLHFDILGNVEKMSPAERELLIKGICDIVIPPADGKDRYFIPNARNFFCGILTYLLDQNIHMDFATIVDRILKGDALQWVLTIKNGSCGKAQEYTNGLYGEKPEDVCGCYAHCVDAVKNTFAIGDSVKLFTRSSQCISPVDLENGFDIYIRIPQDKIATYSPMTSIICDSFMRYFMQKPDNTSGIKPVPIIFLLDEFPQLQFKFETISSALATLRSKGVSLLLAQQSVGQIENRYGHDGFKEIMDMCRYAAIMSAKDPTSAKYFQDLIGTEKVLKASVSKSDRNIAKSVSEGRDYIYQQTDFQRLGDRVVIQCDGTYIEAEKTFYFKK